MMTMAMLDEGTSTMRRAAAEAREARRANQRHGSTDRSVVYLSAMTPTSWLARADGAVVKDSAFSPAEIERVRVQQLTSVGSEEGPQGMAHARCGPAVRRESSYAVFAAGRSGSQVA